MKTVTRLQLIDLLAGVKTATPIGFTALTDAGARKTGNPFAQVFKLSRVWPFTGTSYGNAVNRQLAREGSDAVFVPASPRYERLSPALVQFTNGKFGVPVQFNPTLRQASRPLYLVRHTLLAPLQLVPKDAIAPFLPTPSVSNRQLDAGIESPIIWRTYGVESLLRVTLGGETYRVRDARAV